ncbi:MAG: DUF89 family protein [Candidatus Omnitrophica bacterium]|nr:DUF89 family protein [Candidatus Omnitrophota bacterium]
MKTYLDCAPCFVRQALDSVRIVTKDEAIQEQVLREVLRTVGDMDLRMSPPEMGQQIHRLIRKLTGVEDPYQGAKEKFNRLMLEIYAELRHLVEKSRNRLEMAIRLAIAGNVIDLGVKSDLEQRGICESFELALKAPLGGDVEEFAREVSRAKSILYLADNAGEIVCDRLLIEELPLEKVTVVVRGYPIINDATMKDAEETGLPDLVRVIPNGSDAPGTVLSDCSASFRRYFNEADLVIAKGQGNYETLSEVDKNIFFLLKAKCSVIARDLGCPIGSSVLEKQSRDVVSV